MSNHNNVIAAVFDVPGMTAVQYDRVIKDLEAAGLGAPDGRLYHLAAPKGDGWYVLDVWENVDKLNTFAGTLMPILQKNGVMPPQPRILPAHNIIG
ncbi:MAG: hypothetical protein D6706_21455 [Chloroflexi bacterium]|nr:MAG: hypothetical protein D6706_21455 [Chloroflexota bacterium]